MEEQLLLCSRILDRGFARDLDHGFTIGEKTRGSCACELCDNREILCSVLRHRNGNHAEWAGYMCMRCWRRFQDLSDSYVLAIKGKPVRDVVRWTYLALLYYLTPQVDMFATHNDNRTTVDYRLMYKSLSGREISEYVDRDCLKRARQISAEICGLVDRAVVAVWVLRRELPGDVVGQMTKVVAEVMVSSREVFTVVGRYLEGVKAKRR